MVSDSAMGDARSVAEALERSQARYHALFEAIDDGFCIIEFIDGPHGPSSDYVHIEANTGYHRHTGIVDIVGKRLREIAPTEADAWVDLYGTVLRTGQPIRFERQFVEVDRHIEVAAARVEPAGLRQVSVLFRDITERKRAEAALRESEAIARENVQRVRLALAAGAIIGTWFWDLPTDRFTVDEAFARSFGLDPAHGREGLSLAQVVETVHPDDREGLARAINEAIARGGAYAHQYRTRRADGNYYWLEANGRVDRAPDGTPLSFPGVLLDVEERRAAEAERRRVTEMLRELNETLEQRVASQTAELMAAEEALRQSQKMEAVGQLTGGLAHDFNNLLAGISGSLDLMQSRLAQGRYGELDRYINGAQGAARRAAALTHRLLAFSRRQTLDPKPTDVNRLVAEMEDLIQRTVGPQIAVEAHMQEDLWSTLVDPNQLENALLNLSINARDAMPDGGRIVISTANRTLDARAAKDLDLPAGEYVAMCVSDTGTGMTPDVIAKAFDPFFTTKPIGVGTGLGLSMIYGFVRQSGGHVEITSEVGRGTQICIYLPRGLAAEAPAPAPEPLPVSTKPQDKTVLVVDDEMLVRMLVVDAVEDLGLTALEAGDGPQAMKLLRSDVRIDLLVTDVGLPNGMNGRQVADAARELRPDLKIIFVTGYAENAVLSHGHLDANMQIVTKPFDMAVLSNRIQGMVGD
ncbi:ATP-binding protein [Aureimonas sp. ME7]|uniref:ATP-binding protein n=1 Tax=Aureimonas sp. ME7 TaxID=2744252 RepID=UPI0015F495AA|nr:ATP-binding protein [Aureimonas sp. ME7]